MSIQILVLKITTVSLFKISPLPKYSLKQCIAIVILTLKESYAVVVRKPNKSDFLPLLHTLSKK